MSLDFYTLRKRGAKVFDVAGRTETVHFLQLVIRNALSPDAQRIVDDAIEDAAAEWSSTEELPQWVLQVEMDGRPEPGCPIYPWKVKRRLYCFDDELLRPFGYLGEPEAGGFRFRTVGEQEYLNDLATARKIDTGEARVFRDFWAGETFKTGSEFLEYRRSGSRGSFREFDWRSSCGSVLSSRLTKIVGLIRFIESKGQRASSADLQFLSSLRSKALQLGHGLQ